MPLFDYECPACKRTVEILVTHTDQSVTCAECWSERSLVRVMRRLPAAPSFTVKGFNSMTGYASEQTRSERKGSVRTEVKGNFEAFDRLV